MLPLYLSLSYHLMGKQLHNDYFSQSIYAKILVRSLSNYSIKHETNIPNESVRDRLNGIISSDNEGCQRLVDGANRVNT